MSIAESTACELAELLRRLADRVEKGDCLEVAHEIDASCRYDNFFIKVPHLTLFNATWPERKA